MPPVPTVLFNRGLFVGVPTPDFHTQGEGAAARIWFAPCVASNSNSTLFVQMFPQIHQLFLSSQLFSEQRYWLKETISLGDGKNIYWAKWSDNEIWLGILHFTNTSIRALALVNLLAHVTTHPKVTRMTNLFECIVCPSTQTSFPSKEGKLNTEGFKPRWQFTVNYFPGLPRKTVSSLRLPSRNFNSKSENGPQRRDMSERVTLSEFSFLFHLNGLLLSEFPYCALSYVSPLFFLLHLFVGCFSQLIPPETPHRKLHKSIRTRNKVCQPRVRHAVILLAGGDHNQET